jgi:hypothetical protein
MEQNSVRMENCFFCSELCHFPFFDLTVSNLRTNFELHFDGKKREKTEKGILNLRVSSTFGGAGKKTKLFNEENEVTSRDVKFTGRKKNLRKK